VKLSAVLSIHNRKTLFGRALPGYLWQTMPPDQWEIILVDDGSDADLTDCYRAYEGRINLSHVYLDHTRHPIFRERNPLWAPGLPKDWYHTPALSINAGVALARGEIICLAHPEILHKETNFDLAYGLLTTNKLFAFSPTILGTAETNRIMAEGENLLLKGLRPASDPPWTWTMMGWQGFLQAINARTLQQFGPTERYWYCSFLPRAAVEAVRGVDFDYLGGVAGEDDDFRDRVAAAGWPSYHAPELESVHQNHDDETEPHRIRTSEKWTRGLERNRAIYAGRKKSGWIAATAAANSDYDWTALECVAKIRKIEFGKDGHQWLEAPRNA
jgi:glycosyltransferase involved in cell wall biosynthesis